MPFDSKYISTQNLDTFGESLVNVDLSNNVIVGELPSDSFTSNTQLFSIDLSGNQLSGKMKSGTFSSNNRLSTLVLSGNDLDHVETSCFPSSLTTLDISHNKITSLETDAFLVGNSLEVLDLSGNKLESIGGGLDFSDVSGSKEWSHLRSLNVSFNNIASVEANAFAGLTNIEQISIQKNHVATIQGTAFRGCTKLKEIDLSGNQLEETLAMGIFENLPALRVITLVGNVVTADTLVVGTLGNNKVLIDGKVLILCAVSNVANSDKASGVADLTGVEGVRLTVNCLENFHISGSTSERSATATCGANGEFDAIVCVADANVGGDVDAGVDVDVDADADADADAGAGATGPTSTNASPSSLDSSLSNNLDIVMFSVLISSSVICCCCIIVWCFVVKKRKTQEQEQLTKITPMVVVIPLVLPAKRDELVSIVQNYVGTFAEDLETGLTLDNVKRMIEESVEYMTTGHFDDEFVMIVSQNDVEKLAACWNQYAQDHATAELISLFLIAEVQATPATSKSTTIHQLARLIVKTALKKYKNHKKKEGSQEGGHEKKSKKKDINIPAVRQSQEGGREKKIRKKDINISAVGQVVL